MVDDRQFLISKKALEKPGFTSVSLTDGYILSYHTKLPVYIHRSRQILLLGTAWQVREDRRAPVSEIERLAGENPDGIGEQEIFSMEESWCGRYVLIIQGRVYLDAAGQLGVFYSSEGISGSIHLLAEQMGLPEKRFQASSDLNWLPGPLTQYDQIRRQLPSQVYDYFSGSLHARPLLASQGTEYEREEDRVEEFCNSFSCSLRNMQRTLQGKKFLIALTGGYDSRTLLALAEKAGLPFVCFTLEYDDIPADDIQLPKKLCEAAGCGHIYIHRDSKRYSSQLAEEYARHTGGLADDGDKLHYAYGQYQDLAGHFGDAVVLRSSVWEVATDYIEKITGEELDAESIFNYYGIGEKSLEGKSLEEFFRWSSEHPQRGISAANLFFWEQRYGSWMSSIEQSFDMMDGILSLQPVNSRMLLTMLMGFPREERILKRHQVRIIARACPVLAQIRFGTDQAANSTPVLAAAEKVKQLFDRLHCLGFQKTVRIYRKLFRMKWLKRNLKGLQEKDGRKQLSDR